MRHAIKSRVAYITTNWTALYTHVQINTRASTLFPVRLNYNNNNNNVLYNLRYLPVTMSDVRLYYGYMYVYKIDKSLAARVCSYNR